MAILCVNRIIINLEDHLTSRLYLWETRKWLVRGNGAWHLSQRRAKSKVSQNYQIQKLCYSQKREQAIFLCHRINTSFTTQCDQWNRDKHPDQSWRCKARVQRQRDPLEKYPLFLFLSQYNEAVVNSWILSTKWWLLNSWKWTATLST